jgi:type IX secretion system PorP/SprF family membrane protein
MKKFLTLALTVVCFELAAQYLPNNSQTFQFSPILNPGFSGIESFNDLKLSYRYQWTSFGEFSPKFINLSYNARIKQPLDLSYNSIRISDPSLVRPQGIPRGKRIIHGLAGHVFQSKVGVIESIGGGATYAFHYPIVRQWRISLGVSAFVENRKLDMNEVTVRDPDNDKFYNHLLNSSTSQTDLNLRGGLLLYTSDFYFGVSYIPAFYTSLQASELAFEEPFYTATIMAGYSVQVNPTLAFKPSVLAILLADNSVMYDASIKAYLQNKVWAGIMYRSIKSGVGMVGFNFNEKFNASYSFEMAFGEFQQFSGSTHELVLGMRLNNLKRQNQYTW